jgi:hypothetical protein
VLALKVGLKRLANLVVNGEAICLGKDRIVLKRDEEREYDSSYALGTFKSLLPSHSPELELLV